MLYSSSKSSVITAAETEASIQVIKKVKNKWYVSTWAHVIPQFETSDLEDLTEDYFSEELNAVSSGTSSSSGSIVGDRINMLGGTKQGFKRPVAPGRRRPGTTSTA